MKNLSKRKKTVRAVLATDTSMKDYENDPYFVKKREMATVFLKKVGLPESFKKPKVK
jgi:hypothetical protein